MSPEPAGRPNGPVDAVAKMLRLPFSTPEFIDRIVMGTASEVGKRTLWVLFTTWDQAGGGPFAATSVGGAGADRVVGLVLDLTVGPIFEPVLRRLGADSIRLRATLAASQLVGIGMMRYASKTEPIASMEVSKLVDMISPTLQRYLTGPLP